MKPMTTEWALMVRLMLSEGYGVEDIARATETDAEAVRGLVGAMRRTGLLTGLYERAHALWAEDFKQRFGAFCLVTSKGIAT